MQAIQISRLPRVRGQFSSRGTFSPGARTGPGLGYSPGWAGRPALGQTNEEWYRRAKDAVAKYQQLLLRLGQVANQTARADIMRWLGDPAVAGTPAYRYQTVVSDLQTDVERFRDPITGMVNVAAYSVERRRGRVRELEDNNRLLEQQVAEAERVYGVLPGPRVITVPGPARGPDLTVPLVLGGGVAALLLLGVI